MGGALALIPAALGVASQLGLFGKTAKEGKKVEYEAQAPEYQQEFAEEFFKYLQGQVGEGATPYRGQVAAPFVNPFSQGAYGAMSASPYGSMMGGLPMGGEPFVPPQQQRPGGTSRPTRPVPPPGTLVGLGREMGGAQSPQLPFQRGMRVPQPPPRGMGAAQLPQQPLSPGMLVGRGGGSERRVPFRR